MKQNWKSTPLIKRIFDILFALLAVIILSPVFIFVLILLVISDGFPVFFTQTRPGKNGKPFKLYKFRTMKEARNQKSELLTDGKRITKLGGFLRRTSVDELPELFNVLMGKMSIVGPRPLLMQYLERYSDEQARRHEVLPGITGWAQINGRNAISWEEKFNLDVWYVDNWSFCLDIKIIFQTIWKVIKGEGISQPGRATMEEFMGNTKK
ncbi:MAG: sugar transferase [Anaerolineaceae bacterium]|nr:sugar transferase [Anaerolineaceae bacterium]